MWITFLKPAIPYPFGGIPYLLKNGYLSKPIKHMISHPQDDPVFEFISLVHN
jgi:hypothetical protein